MTSGGRGGAGEHDGDVAPDEFERRAAERVASLGDGDLIDLDTFAAMFDLFRASTRIIGDLESTVHRPAGLSMAGFRVLFTVWVFGSLEPREIARLAGVSTAAVSGVLTTLERDQLVEKARRDDDRRRVDVTLTDAGHRCVADAYRAQNARERVVFADIDRRELHAFTATLRRLLRTPLD